MLWDLISKNFWITSKIICMVAVLLMVVEYLELRIQGWDKREANRKCS